MAGVNNEDTIGRLKAIGEKYQVKSNTMQALLNALDQIDTSCKEAGATRKGCEIKKLGFGVSDEHDNPPNGAIVEFLQTINKAIEEYFAAKESTAASSSGN